ncbi:MAG: hypothetical protein PHG23_01840 [Candidatus Pacebacteria bacterium]|nr:hypothetical protein [Candidatus Paceibacterota bacterium]
MDQQENSKTKIFCPYCGEKIGQGEHVCTKSESDFKILPRPTFIESFIRTVLGVLLLLSAIPLIMNFITIPLIILCFVFAVYMLRNKGYNMALNLIGLFAGIALYFFLGVFNSFKVMLFYAPINNNDFIGFLLFSPAVILLLLCSLFMFVQGLLYENGQYRESKSRGLITFGIFLLSALLVFGFPMTKQLEVKTGSLEGENPNGSRQNVIISFDGSNKQWMYIVKRKNETDKPLIVTAVYGNKTQLTETDNIMIENGAMSGNKITIEPYKEAIITIYSKEPLYTMTFTFSDTLADSYKFIK